MKNNLTFTQLDYLCMKQAGNLSEEDIDSQYRQLYVNNNLMKMFQVLDGLQDPWYNKSTVLTIAITDQAYLKDSGQSGTITALSTSGSIAGSILTITGPTLVAGQMLDVILVLKADGTIVNQCLARVVTGGTTSTAIILSPATSAMTTYASGTHHLSVLALASYSGTTIDVSGIYFKDFVKIYDDRMTTTPGAGNRVFRQYKDSQLFGGLASNPIIKNIGWYQRGDTIELFVPFGANPIGTVTGEYRGKPALYTDATALNSIDINPEQNRLLMDLVVTDYLIDKGKDVPAGLAATSAAFQKVYDAAQADKIKAMEIKNK